MPAEKQATFTIRLDSNAPEAAREAAAELRKLQDRVLSSKERMIDLGSQMRRLAGSTDEVKEAKEKLKAVIGDEREGAARLNIAMTKQKVLLDRLRASQKPANAEAKQNVGIWKQLTTGFKLAGGPVSEASGRIGEVGDRLGALGGIAPVGVAGIAALAAAAVIATVAIAGAGAALADFIFKASDAARSAQLFREAATGSATNATNLGDQVALLASKVPTAKDALNKLAASTYQAFANTRIGGQGIVDTFNAVAQASAILGDSAARPLQDIIERGKMLGRIQINPLELVGKTPLEFKSIAKSLADTMHVSVAEASKALFEGRVPIDAGAKAIRLAVEGQFGSLNKRALLSFPVQLAKLRERFEGFAAAATSALEPLLEKLNQVLGVFDEGTVTGQAIKVVFEDFGRAIADVFGGALPSAKTFGEELVNMALRVDIAFLKLRIFMKEHSEAIGTALRIVGVAALLVGGIFATIGAVLAAPFVFVAANVLAAAAAIDTLWQAGKKLIAFDWANLGRDIGEGIAAGFAKGLQAITDFASNVAGHVKDAFKNALGIHSPSAVFAEYGRQSAEGFDRGAAGMGERAGDGAADAARPATAGAAATPVRAGAGMGKITLNLAFNFAGGGDAKTTTAALSEPGFLSKLTQAVEEALEQAGVNPAAGAA